MENIPRDDKSFLTEEDHTSPFPPKRARTDWAGTDDAHENFRLESEVPVAFQQIPNFPFLGKWMKTEVAESTEKSKRNPHVAPSDSNLCSMSSEELISVGRRNEQPPAAKGKLLSPLLKDGSVGTPSPASADTICCNFTEVIGGTATSFPKASQVNVSLGNSSPGATSPFKAEKLPQLLPTNLYLGNDIHGAPPQARHDQACYFNKDHSSDEHPLAEPYVNLRCSEVAPLEEKKDQVSLDLMQDSGGNPSQDEEDQHYLVNHLVETGLPALQNQLILCMTKCSDGDSSQPELDQVCLYLTNGSGGSSSQTDPNPHPTCVYLISASEEAPPQGNQDQLNGSNEPPQVEDQAEYCIIIDADAVSPQTKEDQDRLNVRESSEVPSPEVKEDLASHYPSTGSGSAPPQVKEDHVGLHMATDYDGAVPQIGEDQPRDYLTKSSEYADEYQPSQYLADCSDGAASQPEPDQDCLDWTNGSNLHPDQAKPDEARIHLRNDSAELQSQAEPHQNGLYLEHSTGWASPSDKPALVCVQLDDLWMVPPQHEADKVNIYINDSAVESPPKMRHPDQLSLDLTNISDIPKQLNIDLKKGSGRAPPLAKTNQSKHYWTDFTNRFINKVEPYQPDCCLKDSSDGPSTQAERDQVSLELISASGQVPTRSRLDEAPHQHESGQVCSFMANVLPLVSPPELIPDHHSRCMRQDLDEAPDQHESEQVHPFMTSIVNLAPPPELIPDHQSRYLRQDSDGTPHPLESDTVHSVMANILCVGHPPEFTPDQYTYVRQDSEERPLHLDQDFENVLGVVPPRNKQDLASQISQYNSGVDSPGSRLDQLNLYLAHNSDEAPDILEPDQVRVDVVLPQSKQDPTCARSQCISDEDSQPGLHQFNMYLGHNSDEVLHQLEPDQVWTDMVPLQNKQDLVCSSSQYNLGVDSPGPRLDQLNLYLGHNSDETPDTLEPDQVGVDVVLSQNKQDLVCSSSQCISDEDFQPILDQLNMYLGHNSDESPYQLEPDQVCADVDQAIVNILSVVSPQNEQDLDRTCCQNGSNEDSSQPELDQVSYFMTNDSGGVPPQENINTPSFSHSGPFSSCSHPVGNEEDAGIRCSAVCTSKDYTNSIDHRNTWSQFAKTLYRLQRREEQDFCEADVERPTSSNNYPELKPPDTPSAEKPLEKSVESEKNALELNVNENKNKSICDGNTKGEVTEYENILPSMGGCNEGSTVPHNVGSGRNTIVNLQVDHHSGAEHGESTQGDNDEDLFRGIDPANRSEANEEADGVSFTVDGGAGEEKLSKMESPLLPHSQEEQSRTQVDSSEKEAQSVDNNLASDINEDESSHQCGSISVEFSHAERKEESLDAEDQQEKKETPICLLESEDHMKMLVLGDSPRKSDKKEEISEIKEDREVKTESDEQEKIEKEDEFGDEFDSLYDVDLCSTPSKEREEEKNVSWDINCILTLGEIDDQEQSPSTDLSQEETPAVSEDQHLATAISSEGDAVVPCHQDFAPPQNASLCSVGLKRERFSTSGLTFGSHTLEGFDTFEKIKLFPDDDDEDSVLECASVSSWPRQLLNTIQQPVAKSDNPMKMPEEKGNKGEAEEQIERSECPPEKNTNGVLSSPTVNIVSDGSRKQQLSDVPASEQTLGGSVPAPPADPSSDLSIRSEFKMTEEFNLVLKELNLFFEISKNDFGEEYEDDQQSETPLGFEKNTENLSTPKPERHINTSFADEKMETCGEKAGVPPSAGSRYMDQKVPRTRTASWKTSNETSDEHKEPREAKQEEKSLSASIMCQPPLEQLGHKPLEQLRRLEPLKTCKRPIRVGLSKKARTNRLHRFQPYN